MNISKGTILKHRYEILEELGRGGFAVTYKAVDNLVHRYVAIKISEQNLAHEAKILKALNNVPHICNMYDYFVIDNTHFLVMKLIKGKSLSTVRNENGGTISASFLKEILPSALITIDQMHKYNIIHRDISTGNFILTKDNTLYLIDFGGATSLKHSSLKNRHNINHVGLDAPEKNNSALQGTWTDIYSLCATIVFLLTGEGIPLPEDRAQFDPIPALLARTSLSTKKQNALFKGLMSNPAKRYQTIMDFEKDFFARESSANTPALEASQNYQVHYHAKTDIGTRPVNQDNFMIDTLFNYAGEDCEIKGYIDCGPDELHVVAIADGVASSNYAEFASKAAIQAVSHFIDSYKYSDVLPQNLLEEFMNQLNEKIISLSKKIGKTASTISILLWKNNDYIVANIGDSPIYQLSKGKLSCLTSTHTLANVKIQNGEIPTVRDFHTLTRFLGREKICGQDMTHIKTGTISKGDIFLICSDGISEILTDSSKKKYMKKDGDKAIRTIYKFAHKNNNIDNCTAIILKF